MKKCANINISAVGISSSFKHMITSVKGHKMMKCVPQCAKYYITTKPTMQKFVTLLCKYYKKIKVKISELIKP